MGFGTTKQLELGSLLVRTDLTGSLQRTPAGVPFIAPAGGLTVTTASSGQVIIGTSVVGGQTFMPSMMLGFNTSDDALINLGTRQCVTFPSGVSSSIYMMSQVPAGYVTGSHVPVFGGFVYLLNGAASGTIAFETSFMKLTSGSSMPSPSWSPVGDQVARTFVITSSKDITLYHSNSGGMRTGDWFYVRFRRLNATGGDTLPLDVQLSALRVQYLLTGTVIS